MTKPDPMSDPMGYAAHVVLRAVDSEAATQQLIKVAFAIYDSVGSAADSVAPALLDQLIVAVESLPAHLRPDAEEESKQ